MFDKQRTPLLWLAGTLHVFSGARATALLHEGDALAFRGGAGPLVLHTPVGSTVLCIDLPVL